MPLLQYRCMIKDIYKNLGLLYAWVKIKINWGNNHGI